MKIRLTVYVTDDSAARSVGTALRVAAQRASQKLASGEMPFPIPAGQVVVVEEFAGFVMSEIERVTDDGQTQAGGEQ